MDYIIYNGIDSRTFGVYLVRRGKTPLLYNSAPPSRVKTEKIAGRHGTIAVEQLYEPRQLDMELYFSDTRTPMMLKIASWLGKIGTHKLIKSTEPYKFYYATFEQGLNPEIHNIKQGIVGITFTAYDPFGYSNFTTLELVNQGINYDSGLLYGSGLEYVDLSTHTYVETVPTVGNVAIEVLQGGNSDFALPKIIVEAGASGAGGFKLEHFYGGTTLDDKVAEIIYSNSIPANGSVIIDSEIGDTYDENGAILSEFIEGDYFTFKGVGDPELIFLGSCKFISTTEVELDSNASNVDDFYNGFTLSTNNSIDMGAKYGKIIDYNGTTKVATLDLPTKEQLDKILNCGIYDFSGKLNYIKYSYSAPVVLEPSTISFDFRFNYL